MKYPASPLTSFLAVLSQNPPHGYRRNSPTARTAQALSDRASMACALLNSLVALFSFAVVCFQELAHSFAKTPAVRWGVPLRNLRVLCASALPFAVVTSVPRFQELTSCSLHLIDLHPPRFHAFTNCFFRKPFLFTSIQIAGGVASAGEKASRSNGEPEPQGMYITAGRRSDVRLS